MHCKSKTRASNMIGLMAGVLLFVGCQGAGDSVDEIVMGAEEIAVDQTGPILAQRYERCALACTRGNVPGWEVHSSCLSSGGDGANVCIAYSAADADSPGASCAVPCSDSAR